LSELSTQTTLGHTAKKLAIKGCSASRNREELFSYGAASRVLLFPYRLDTFNGEFAFLCESFSLIQFRANDLHPVNAIGGSDFLAARGTKFEHVSPQSPLCGINQSSVNRTRLLWR
jgi:hypothetical protein